MWTSRTKPNPHIRRKLAFWFVFEEEKTNRHHFAKEAANSTVPLPCICLSLWRLVQSETELHKLHGFLTLSPRQQGFSVPVTMETKSVLMTLGSTVVWRNRQQNSRHESKVKVGWWHPPHHPISPRDQHACSLTRRLDGWQTAWAREKTLSSGVAKPTRVLSNPNVT